MDFAPVFEGFGEGSGALGGYCDYLSVLLGCPPGRDLARYLSISSSATTVASHFERLFNPPTLLPSAPHAPVAVGILLGSISTDILTVVQDDCRLTLDCVGILMMELLLQDPKDIQQVLLLVEHSFLIDARQRQKNSTVLGERWFMAPPSGHDICAMNTPSS